MLVSSTVMVVLYCVNALGAWIPELSEWAARLTNVEGRAKEGGIEIVEALLWGFSAIAFGRVAFQLFRRSGGHPLRARLSGRLLWCGFFALLAFMALGEETSWGQVYGWYSAPESVAAVNAQEEFNLHNLDMAEIWGLDPDHPLVPYLGNLSHIINPVFYAFFLAAWVIVPLGLRRNRLRSRVWTGYPVPPPVVSSFFLANFVAWLVIDRLLFDVGELFELSISLTMAMVAGCAVAAWREEARASQVQTAEKPEEPRLSPAAVLDDFSRHPGAAAQGETPTGVLD
ncbi:MAG: hypothetical protein OEO23_09945 [Gemmatimonadota bacterium]|nr:hypothetical protein [Gemmatimonadota bacterium]